MRTARHQNQPSTPLRTPPGTCRRRPWDSSDCLGKANASREMLGGKPHFTLEHAAGWGPIAKLHDRPLHETTCLKRRTNGRKEFVGIRPIHIESAVASINCNLIAVVL